MASERVPSRLAELPRFATGVPGLDVILRGGLLAGDAYLITGAPGTGKTTLGNQLAFAHAASGGSVVFATLLTETHDRMLAHLRGFRFADPELVGDRLRYLSVLRALEEGGLDGALEELRRVVRDHSATLLVIDGAGATMEAAASRLDFGRFAYGLQAISALMGCTTVLLSAEIGGEAGAAASLDGVIELTNEPIDSHDARWLRVAKLRGSSHLSGRHEFAIGEAGLEVFPRLEAAVGGRAPAWEKPGERLAFGVPGMDVMLAGGLLPRSTTMVLGTPGAGKTVLGLHFVAEGARQGEPALLASFHEPPDSLVATAMGIGQDLRRDVETGLVQMRWRAPLEVAPDAWAWDLLAAVEAHRSRRVVIDAFSDVARLFSDPRRQVPFATALAHALRVRGATTLFLVEYDAFAGQELVPPVPDVSASMDNGLLLRTSELRGRLVRLTSVLKTRQSPFDHAIREFSVTDQGIVVGEAVENAAGLLTGGATPAGDPT